MAVDSFLGLWNPAACFALVCMSVVTLAIGEYMASKVHIDPSLHNTRHHHTSADGSAADHLRHYYDIYGNFFSLEMPNYWIWYDGSAIRDVLKAQVDNQFEFIIVTIYNCVWATSVVGCTLMVVTMTLAIRAFSFDDVFLRRWLSPGLCVVAFAADMFEDLFLLRIAIAWPHYDFPLLEQATAWMSFIKFLTWFVILLWWLTMGFFIVVKPPQHLSAD